MRVRWWKRLIFRIPALIMLVTLIPLLVFGIITNRMSTQALTREVGRANLAAATQVVDLIEGAITGVLENMTIAVSSPEFSGMDYETQKLTVQSLLRIFPDVKTLAVLDEGGDERVKFSRQKVYLPNDLVNRTENEEFKQSIQGLTFTGSVQTSAEGIPILELAVPIWDLARQETMGVLVAEVSLRGLLEQIVRIQIGESGYVFIVDGSGKVIAHPDYSLVLAGEDFSDQPHIRHFLKGEPTDEAHRYASYDGIEVIGVGKDIPDLGWIVIVEQPVEEALAASRQMTSGLIHTLSATLLLAVFIVGYALLRLIKPLQDLEKGAGFIGKGDLEYRIEVQSQDEIGQLANAFNKMVNDLKAHTTRLVQSNRDLEEFVYIASHDLQEPLRKILAFGDRLVARYSDNIDETGQDYMNRMHDATQRMQTLIDDLLIYSRVSTKAQPGVQIDLTDVAQAVLTELESQLQQTGGRLEFESLPTIEADPVQMHQLLQHLIVNSLKFRREGVPPIVELRGNQIRKDDSTSTEMCQIIVVDNGMGFEQQFADRIFKPFQRLHRRGEYDGSGMGLAICRRIVERHGGSIITTSVPGQGTTFTITLPLMQSKEISSHG